ncbi:MAG TPA: DUF1127 domain-containing protein [Devosia sp.]|nr:DUF1127 domain-containing protein [Devosia sp.]
MTSIDHDSMPLGIEDQQHRFGLLQAIAGFFAGLAKRRRRKRAIQQISTLDEHLLRDIGLNPQDFRDAFENRRSSLLFTPFREPYERD